MRKLSLRDHILTALADIEVPVNRAELAEYLRAKLGPTEREVRMQHLIPVAERERAAFARNPEARQVWICHPLTARHLEPMWGVFARSDWPLERRIESTRGGRIRSLKYLIRLCELAAAAEPAAADPLALRRICRKAAQGLPSGRTGWDIFEFEQWKAAALAELASVERLDAQQIQRVAAIVAQLPLEQQLYGSLASAG